MLAETRDALIAQQQKMQDSLDEINKEVSARVWAEGHKAGLHDGVLGYGPLADYPDTPNPYMEN